MLPAASKAGKEAANVHPEPQGRAWRHFSLWSPQELRQRLHPSIATENDFLKSGFLCVCVCGWQCLVWWDLGAWLVVGTFWGCWAEKCMALLVFHLENTFNPPLALLGASSCSGDGLGQVWGHRAVTPWESCCSGTWGTEGAVTSSPSPLLKEQKKISFFQGWFHLSLEWHRAGAAWQDRGWQHCPWQVLCSLPSCASQWHTAPTLPLRGHPYKYRGQHCRTKPQNRTCLRGLSGGESPLGFTTSSLWPTRNIWSSQQVPRIYPCPREMVGGSSLCWTAI